MNFQITRKPRCTAQIPNKWWHGALDKQGTHQCPFPIWKDGYCTRHHPEITLAILLRREEVLLDQLESNRKAIVKAQKVLARKKSPPP